MRANSKKEVILVVDDALDTLEILQRNLELKGYKVFTVSSASEAVKILEKTHIDLVITDLKMPVVNGLELVRYIRENYKDIEVIMITGYPSIQGAVEALKAGADNYLAKPFTEEELFSAVQKALKKLSVRRKTQQLSNIRSSYNYGIIGNSKAMQKVFEAIEKAAKTSATVLITGETGTGKELVARAIHYNSSRASAPFVAVNCGAIPEELFESELFGHVKGAFTGASATKAGFFQTAQGGTIFLDEISSISPLLQVKLLRAIQEKEIYMVGSTKPIKIDVRIIAATNKDLLPLVKEGTFREDLYYRLNVINIYVPPLRERGDDIILLANYFARKFSEELGKPVPRFTEKALDVLKSYSWPGNVRELENLIMRLVIMTDGGIIDVPDLPPNMRFSISQEYEINRTLAEVEAEHIRRVLASVKGNKTKAAQILGIDRKTLREKIKKFQISW